MPQYSLPSKPMDGSLAPGLDLVRVRIRVRVRVRVSVWVKCSG